MEFVDTYAGLDEDEYRRYESEYSQENTAMAGVIQRARDEAKQEGIREGLNQGMARGARSVLERLLRRRFGLLPPRIARRLQQASAGDLETWTDNVLDASSLDEVFRTGP